jgi:hypothetical protein
MQETLEVLVLSTFVGAIASSGKNLEGRFVRFVVG